MGRKLLDLYCCEGLGAWGYWRSGRFSEIVGVDVVDYSSIYAFDFIRADALKLTYEFLLQFDFIHASPPCQAYSWITPESERWKHPRLILPTKLMLAAAGVPHVVENVAGSTRELRPNLTLTGRDVGLPMDRRRYFYVSTLDKSRPSGSFMSEMIDDHHSQEMIKPHGSDTDISRSELIRAFGLESMINPHRLKSITMAGIGQGIPPAMTYQIIETVIPHKLAIA
jgi:hypothetical protein